jgi:AbrB family looped-hinge helix DNA binding protein
MCPFQSWFKEASMAHQNLLGDSVGTNTVAKTTTPVKVDEQGRCYIPKPARELLGIDGEEVTVEITVEYDE